MKRVTLLAIAVIVACSPAAPAQTIQTTWQQPAYTAQTTVAPSPIFRNVNQAAHWLSYCISGGTIDIWLEASADGVTNWVPISQVAVAALGTCNVLSTGGYYFAVRANFSLVSGGPFSLSATYSASTNALATPQNIGQQFNSLVTTYQPMSLQTGNIVQFKSTWVQLTANSIVLYGATLYNPNAGTVYVGFEQTVSGAPSSGEFVMAIPAGQSIAMNLPQPGAIFSGGLWVSCSTSLTGLADPASACVISPFTKNVGGAAAYNEVPN